MMKAWLQREAGATPEWLDLPMPQPQAGQVLVRVAAAALNFSDLLMMRGAYQIRPPLPFTPGQEISGTVERVLAPGPFKPGDRVATKVLWGGLAEYAIAQQGWLIRVPDTLPLDEASTLPVVWPTAWIALFDRAQLQAGETVLVHAGAGALGLACIQLAVQAGARVIATAGGPEKLALCLQRGAAVAVDYRNADWVEQVLATAAGGVNVIIDSVGGEITDGSLKCLAHRGRLCLVGFSSGRIPELRGNRLLLKNASALGVYWNHERDAALVDRAMAAVLQGFSHGSLQADIGGRFALEALPEALARLEQRKSVGKLLMLASGEEQLTARR